MQWWRGDSNLLDHDKFTELDSQDALTLWFVIGIRCGQAETDGVIRPGRLRGMFTDAYLETRPRQTKALKRLVEARLLHDSTTVVDCEDCRNEFSEVERGTYVVHNWNDHQPRRDDKTDPAKAFKANRKRRLKKLVALKEQIRRRDRGFCRYCGLRVNMADHTSIDGGTYDHVDPEEDNSFDNVVIACRGCNGHKGERTPAEAGMELLPPPAQGTVPERRPRPYVDDPGAGSEPGPAGSRAGSEPGPAGSRAGTGPGSEPVPSRDQPPENPGPEPGPASRSAQLGPEPARSRLGTGSGPGSARPATVGPGAARLGTALLGTARNGQVGFGKALHGTDREPPPGGRADPPPDRTRAADLNTEDSSS